MKLLKLFAKILSWLFVIGWFAYQLLQLDNKRLAGRPKESAVEAENKNKDWEDLMNEFEKNKKNKFK